MVPQDKVHVLLKPSINQPLLDLELSSQVPEPTENPATLEQCYC